jgi:hypothetical protein
LPQDRGNGAGARGKLQAWRIGGSNPHLGAHRSRQVCPDGGGQARLESMALRPVGQRRVALENLRKR